jgi:N-acetylglucosaminyl-diphospho-decaprenol L-rhamnosyltransferase
MIESAASPQSASAATAARPQVSAIVVTYRSAGYVDRCLAALNDALAGLAAEIVIVDNASGDAIAEVVQSVMPRARLVVRSNNGGFAAGCRSGAEVARGRWLLFVNPDALVASDCVTALLDCAEGDRGVGIVGGRCVDSAGRTDPRSWWGRPSLWSTFCFAAGLSTLFPGHRLFDPESPRPLSAVRSVPVVTGALMLVDRQVWDALDGFDPAFFMYGEDADFCLRAWAGGWRPTVTPEAVFVHPGGASSSSERKLLMLLTGKATVLRRHLRPGAAALGVRLLLMGVLLRAGGGWIRQSVDPVRQGRPTTRSDVWRSAWRRRRDWAEGWRQDAAGVVGGPNK